MASRHVVRPASEARFTTPPAFAERSEGFRRWSIADAEAGSHHMEFAVCALDAGGSIDWHVHSYEESFHVLAGEVVCETGEGAFALREGDYGMVPVGSPHTWRNVGSEPARWAEMLAPQPNPSFGGEAVFVPPLPTDAKPIPVDVRDPRTRSFGHVDRASVDKTKQSQDLLAQSASMRTALLVYSGINIKMMVDTDLGAQLSTMFMVGYDEAGVAGPHDHPFEEAYLMIEGEVDVELDGEHFHLGPGDGAWAGTGCVHSFTNPKLPIRWLETQAPQPPARHAYRWIRDWSYVQDKRD
jgi:quercetin dioxygenase-like cupin family protein